MSETGRNRTIEADSAVESLLGRASPRPAPPAGDEQLVREAVEAEWRAVTRSRSRRLNVLRFAAAASIVLAALLTFNSFRTDGIVPVQVASIVKSHGSIYLLGEQSELTELHDIAAITAGQTIITGSGAGIGLAWVDGGSLRIDADTRIEFRAADRIYLRSGRVYFDSAPGLATAAISGGSSPALLVETDHGTVTHIGTQYMAYSDASQLRVSVREGEVAIAGNYHDVRAVRGQQLTVVGSARPTATDFAIHGSAWKWAEATAPNPDLDGRKVSEFLAWVGHETGLRLHYDSEAAEQLAATARFNGVVRETPTRALATWMMTIDLDYDVRDGEIRVTAIDSGSEP